MAFRQLSKSRWERWGVRRLSDQRYKHQASLAGGHLFFHFLLLWRWHVWLNIPPLLFYSCSLILCLQRTSLSPLALSLGKNSFQGWTLLAALSGLLSSLMMFDGRDQGRVNIPLVPQPDTKGLLSHWMTQTLTTPWQWGPVTLWIIGAVSVSRAVRQEEVGGNERSNLCRNVEEHGNHCSVWIMYDAGTTYQFSFKRSIAPGNGLMGDIDCRRLRNLPSVKVAINKGMITWAQLINSSLCCN